MTWLHALRALHGEKVATAIEELHRVETDLAGALLHVSDRHRADHEVFHVARDLARWSQLHVRDLAEVGRGYDLDLDPEPDPGGAVLGGVRRKASELTGRWHDAGLLLIADLRHVHRMAAGASLDWEVLAQLAQSLEEAELLALCQRHHPQTLRQLRWANAKVKETAAQVMVTS